MIRKSEGCICNAEHGYEALAQQTSACTQATHATSSADGQPDSTACDVKSCRKRGQGVRATPSLVTYMLTICLLKECIQLAKDHLVRVRFRWTRHDRQRRKLSLNRHGEVCLLLLQGNFNEGRRQLSARDSITICNCAGKRRRAGAWLHAWGHVVLRVAARDQYPCPFHLLCIQAFRTTRPSHQQELMKRK